jgi:Zn-finger protein
MTYLAWYKRHGEKHRQLMQKLEGMSNEEIITYFDFDHMKKTHPDFCPLYRDSKKCHDMEHLNCYLCACPYFRFDDEGLYQEKGKTVYSLCTIDAAEGKRFESGEAIHQDCSGCLLPHRRSFVRKHFSKEWFEIMQQSISSDDQ